MVSQKTKAILDCKSILSDSSIIAASSMRAFASILTFRVKEGYENYDSRQRYLERTKPQLKSLPFPLARPDPVTKLLLSKQLEASLLCHMHKKLNSDFVHQWFLLLVLEVGRRMNSLIAAETCGIPKTIYNHEILSLRRLHEMWLRSESTDTLGVSKDCPRIDNFDYSYQENKCEACILSRIGTSFEIVLALLCIVQSRFSCKRNSSGRKQPRLQRLLLEWINIHRQQFQQLDQMQYFDNCISTNIERSKCLHRIRKTFYRVRHGQKGSNRSYDCSYRVQPFEGNFREEKSEDIDLQDLRDTLYSTENNIIDQYATQMSRGYMTDEDDEWLENNTENDIDKLNLKSTKCYEKQNDGQLFRPGFNESKYSIDTINNNRRVIDKTSSSIGVPIVDHSRYESLNLIDTNVSPRSQWHINSSCHSKPPSIAISTFRFVPSRQIHHKEALRVLESCRTRPQPD